MPTHNLPEHDRAAPLRRSATADASAADAGPAQHPLLTLQRQVGNAQIARMLAQREDAPAPEEDDEELKKLQAKHDPALAQREDAPEEDDEEELKKLMQAMPEVGLEGGPVSEALAGRIETQRGGGAPLDDGMRAEMEGALGASFEDVRVHSDAESQQLNRNISAKAFTTGSDIFLGRDASAGDRDLMAHELTHVVQQRSMSTSGPMSVGPAGDSYEQQADATAAAVAAGAPAPAQRESEENR
jgi:hypothetical protein